MSKFGKYLWKMLILICLLGVGTLDMQAVEQPATGIVYLVCYRAVEQKLDQNRGVLRVDSPALLMARYHSMNRIFKNTLQIGKLTT